MSPNPGYASYCNEMEHLFVCQTAHFRCGKKEESENSKETGRLAEGFGVERTLQILYSLCRRGVRVSEEADASLNGEAGKKM